MVPLALLGVVGTAVPAHAVAAVSSARLATSGFPVWYEDNAGTRVEACLDANDPNCILPPASATYNPLLPLSVPGNFPDEFFYAMASSDLVDTPGCGGTAPGRASVRLALEGAFVNGSPAGGDQMTFGRIRVKVTSGLCPNTTYRFKHPFATVTLTTDAAGAIPANVGTVDVGCRPTPTTPCDYTAATASPVLGSATDGFLRWSSGAPAGYLGDGVTLHTITGGTNGNTFEIQDAAGAPTGLFTDQFVVTGKVAGPLLAEPSPTDLGVVVANATSPTKVVTVTNLARGAVTTGGNPVRLRSNNGFGLVATTCGRVTLNRDGTCTISLNVRSGAVGPLSNFVDLTYTLGGVAQTFGIPVSATITPSGSAPVVTVTPAGPLAFGNVRVKTASTSTKTITNTGTAALKVASLALTDPVLGADASQYRITSETCTTRTVAVGGTCAITVLFTPTTNGADPASLVIASNAGVTTVPVTGTGTGGTAAVSATTDASDGFPDWYRDENGVKLSQCVDAKDPFCVVLPDATFDPAAPLAFPTNFPGEFFYTVADSDQIATPGCSGTAPGRAFVRSALEGTFVTGAPAAGDQMVFGRERIAVTSGLCPNSPYTFVTPYGQTTLTTNRNGGIARNAGTVDIGCVPVAPATCDFSQALSDPVLGGFLRWDPAVAPAAPAGYLGDAKTFHSVVGAPYKEDGTNPSNYIKISGAGLPATGLRTSQFTVMGKMRGPLEATGGVDAAGAATLATTAVGSTSAATTITLTNTGVSAPITISALNVTGPDAADFAVASTTCRSGALAVGASCTVDVAFSPSATGQRTAGLDVTHDGLNNPFSVPLKGIGAAGGGTPAISFAPRSLDFGTLAVGGVSAAEQVTVSNAGGSAPLVVSQIVPGNASFTVSAETCTGAPVAPGASCTVDVVFSPVGAGAADTTLRFTDNAPAPGSSHTVALAGSGFGGAKAVSGTLDVNGFPRYFQDGNGTRLEPCLDPSHCVLLADQFYDPTQPLAFPQNFPAEFFYALADSEQLTTSCNGVGSGSALLRLALEGSFATTAGPVPGDQTAFTRIRLGATGLCPNVTPLPDGTGGYTAVTPYGSFVFGTDATGALKKTDGTQDTGCGAAPCTFSDALTSPGAVFATVRTPADGFLRWDPNKGATPPAGYLGDAISFRPVTGGTYVRPGTTGTFNGFEILDPAGNVVAGTQNFLVSGKVAGPLFADRQQQVDFGHVGVGASSATQTITVTNVSAAPTSVTPSLGGPNAGQFAITGGTCGAAAVAVDATCTVAVQFRPGTAGVATASLVLTPGSGRTSSVPLTGTGDAVAAPAITVTPGVLAYGTVAAPASASLTTTISNTGGGALDVTGVAVGGAAAGDFARSGGTCAGASFTLAAGASCTVTVTFTPSAIGARVGSLTLTHNAAGGTTTVSLTGTGAAAAWTASPGSIGFGTVNVNSAKTQSISFRNTGTANGRITAAAIANALPAGNQFTVVTAPATSTCFAATPVAPGKTCSIVVSFTPTAAVAYAADLVVTDPAALPTATVVHLTGTGR